MSIYAASKERSFDDIRNVLGSLVRNFEADPSASRQQIRDLLDNDREGFYNSCMGLLKSDGDSRGAQYLVALLVASGMLLQALSSPYLSREEALALGRAARRVDPMIDVSLARSLAESMAGNTAQLVDPAKLMDVLCEIAESGRIMPSLMRLMRHPNPYLRSKAVKMMGRGSLSAKWVMGRLSESDPRVRANAIESMWGVDTPEARSLLTFALNDADNRVVGNALLGLYYLGEPTALAAVIKLAGHESASFRSSAAWVMGETGDPRFSDALRRMISERDAAVRRGVFASLSQLKAAATHPPVGDPWRVAGREIPGENLKGLRRVLVAVEGADIREQPKVAPLQFFLTEGTHHITSFKCTEKPLPEAMSVVFVIPRSREAAGGAFVEGVMSCLKWKRPADLWSLVPYIETGDGDAPPPRDPEPPVLSSNSDSLAAILRTTPKRLDCTDLWTGVWRATKQEGGQSRGKRHVIVFGSVEEDRVPGEGLVESIQDRRIGVQAVSCGPNRRLRDFCRQARAAFRTGGQEDLVELAQQAYLNLLVRFELAYQPVAAAGSPVKLRVQTPVGWGETLIVPPPDPEQGD